MGLWSHGTRLSLASIDSGPRFLAPCGIGGQNNPRMNPAQFFAEMKRPSVSVFLGAFATSGRLSLQAIAILWAALEAMARGMKLLVRTMALRKTHGAVIPESNRADQCDTTLTVLYR